MSNPDYEVGYAKPPKDSQFKKGKSGNPKGRPKGARNFASYLEEMLKAKVSVNSDGVLKKLNTTQAALAQLRIKALKGNPRALEKLLDYAERFGAEQEAKDTEKALTGADQAIFESFKARIHEQAMQSAEKHKGES